MGKLIPIIMLLLGLGGGVGAGIFLKPAAVDTHGEEAAPVDGRGDSGTQGETSEPNNAHGEDAPPDHNTEGASADNGAGVEYVKMNNQFVVPVVDNEKVKALVVLSLSMEVEAGGKEETFQREPKLRSAFNQVLFDHANAGGFDGVFTDASNMIVLEDSLYEVAVKIMGGIMKDVLIVDIVRQDY